MSKDERAPWKDVADQKYFKKVMQNMVDLGFGPSKTELAYVRFGLTGIGHAPNYQIEVPDSTKHCFRGMGHGKATDAGDEFAPHNLSAERFTYVGVQNMLAQLLGQKGI